MFPVVGVCVGIVSVVYVGVCGDVVGVLVRWMACDLVV